MSVEIRKEKGVRYGRGLASSMRGLGDVHSRPFAVDQNHWDKIFGKKEKPNEHIAPLAEQ